MKSIREYMTDQVTLYQSATGGQQVNEIFGLLLAGALIAYALKDNIKDMMNAKAERDKAKWAHQEKMFELAQKGNPSGGSGGSGGSGEGALAGGLGGLFGGMLTSMIGKSVEEIKDPVEQKEQRSKLDILRCASVDEDGNQRTPEERSKWLQENLSPEDYKDLCEKGSKDWLKTDMKAFVEQTQKEAKNIDEEAIKKELEVSKEKYNDFGKQLEADAEARKELQKEVEAKQAEKEAQQEALNKAIADATAGGNEEEIKAAKLAKAEYNKKMDIAIYEAQKKVTDFEKSCQTSVIMNAANPGRSERIEKTAKANEEAHNKAMEAANKEITDAGGDPANTDPGKKDDTGGKPTPPAGGDDLKKKAEEAAAAQKKAEEDVKAAEEALAKDPENNDLKTDLENKKKAAEEAKKKAEEAAKAAQGGKPTPPAGGDDLKKKAEEAAAAQKKAEEDVKAAEEALAKDPENNDLKTDLENKKKAAEEAKKKAEEAAKAAGGKPTPPAGGDDDSFTDKDGVKYYKKDGKYCMEIDGDVDDSLSKEDFEKAKAKAKEQKPTDTKYVPSQEERDACGGYIDYIHDPAELAKHKPENPNAGFKPAKGGKSFKNDKGEYKSKEDFIKAKEGFTEKMKKWNAAKKLAAKVNKNKQQTEGQIISFQSRLMISEMIAQPNIENSVLRQRLLTKLFN